MTLTGITFRGPELRESAALSELPAGYADLLREINGYVAFGGGFRLRGFCDASLWHSITEAWRGARALHRIFPVVRDSDLPFGQDCMGGQLSFVTSSFTSSPRRPASCPAWSFLFESSSTR